MIVCCLGFLRGRFVLPLRLEFVDTVDFERDDSSLDELEDSLTERGLFVGSRDGCLLSWIDWRPETVLLTNGSWILFRETLVSLEDAPTGGAELALDTPRLLAGLCVIATDADDCAVDL